MCTIQGLVFLKHCSVRMIVSIKLVPTMMGFYDDAVCDQPGPECCHATLNLVVHITVPLLDHEYV